MEMVKRVAVATVREKGGMNRWNQTISKKTLYMTL